MYSETQKETIVRAFQNYISEKAISQNKFAGMVDVNVGYLSAMANRKWNEMQAGSKTVKIDDLYFNRIAQYLGLNLSENFWGHFDTDNYISIVNTLEDARRMKERKALDGATGTGKTYGVTEYKRQNPAGVYLVRCADDLTAKSFMLEMAEAVGVKEFGNRAQIRKAIVKKLLSDTNAPLLIIDEAENLKDGTWGAIKAMCDDLEGHCGIVIVGANQFQQKLSKKAERNIGCFPQIYRRFKVGFNSLFELSLEDVQNVCNQLGIKTRQVQNWMFDHCKNFGELSNALVIVQREAARENAPITPDFCKTVLSK
jgi:DNA transposition AAA+ family ATPase